MTDKHSPPLILVADDQMPTAVMLERVFEYEGYQVECVYDGIAAMDAAKSMLPDLILLDINMPGLNGFEVLKQLRDTSETQNIPTILITAMGDFSNVVQGLNLGADDYMGKPFHPQELLARAESKMKARRLEEALQHRTRELEALLRVSEELSQHLEIEELLDFILYLTVDLIPCQVALVYYLTEDREVADYRTHLKDPEITSPPPQDYRLVEEMVERTQPHTWDEDVPFLSGYVHGIAMPLLFGHELRGIAIVAGSAPYDESKEQLFAGICRQAALAMQNAELYDIKANYALHLEEQVAKRTKELESAQRMLIRSEKLASIGRLAASVAHEINNPLFPIRLDLENMVEDIKNGQPPDASEVEAILNNVERIKYTVDRLLSFTGNKQADTTNAKSLNVNEIINNIITLNWKMLQHAKIEVERHLEDVALIYGNPYQLEYVFMNLTLNAKDAIGQHGIIQFYSYMEGDYVVIEVNDNGEGIPDDTVDTIFEPFVSTKEDGSGLGLYISYDIIQKYNGLIQVESEPGVGTQFILKFPALE